MFWAQQHVRFLFFYSWSNKPGIKLQNNELRAAYIRYPGHRQIVRFPE